MRDDARLVDPSPDVGSLELADALASRDPDAIARALRDGWVILPVRRPDDGPPEVRLFSAGDDPSATGWELTLFSSVATLAAFLAHDEEREFDFVRAASLAGFLEQGRGLIARVVLDPAGPHPVAATVDDVLAVLASRPDDSSAAEQPRGFAPNDRVLDLDLPLGDDWFRIDLTDAATRGDRLGELVDRQLAGLDVGPTLRVQLLQWLRRMTSAAAAGSGRETAFLLRRSESAALALSVTRYWQTLGAGIRQTSHLDTVASRIREKLGPDDELIGATTPAARLLRHTRTVQGSAELRAERMPLLAIDYWLELPDGAGLCLVSFSSPHVDLSGAIRTLTDEIVLESAWVVAARPEESGMTSGAAADPAELARSESPS